MNRIKLVKYCWTVTISPTARRVLQNILHFFEPVTIDNFLMVLIKMLIDARSYVDWIMPLQLVL